MNKEAEGEAWFIKLEIKDASELKSLMGEKEYAKHCEEDKH